MLNGGEILTSNEINELFGISESFMLPERLMELMFSEEINGIFEKYSDMQGDLSYDGFTNYFQEEHSSRKAMMQDFTPKELTELVGKIAGSNVKSCLDVCAGTGGLTIALHSVSPECVFYCEELSKRAVPLLLFNLAVRNISAYVSNKDVLSGEIFEQFQIVPCERFGKILRIDDIPEVPVDVCITNPPYSLKYEFDEKRKDDRFSEYGYPPKQFSDMAFIIHGFSRLKDTGRVLAILPHGVLFRGNKEADIRKKMIEKGNIHAVIGLPDKLFLNTSIPVAVIAFGKIPAEKVIFIDGSRGFEKFGKQNRLRDEDIKKILGTLENGSDIAKFSHSADKAEIVENDYNLNISRYVDTFEVPPPIDIVEVTLELLELERERIRLETEIFSQIMQLDGTDELGQVKNLIGRVFNHNERTEENQVV